MHAVEEKDNIRCKRKRKKDKLILIEPSRLLFKVLVNNYRPPKEDKVEKAEEDIDATMASQQYGLPPQPTSYIKYPDYDWL